MTVLAAACSEGLRDECIESHQYAATEERQHDEKVGAEAYGAHGGRTVGEPPDHHRVDDGHAHPAKFGEDEWDSEPQGRTKFGAKCPECNHGGKIRRTSVSGEDERSK